MNLETRDLPLLSPSVDSARFDAKITGDSLDVPEKRLGLLRRDMRQVLSIVAHDTTYHKDSVYPCAVLFLEPLLPQSWGKGAPIQVVDYLRKEGVTPVLPTNPTHGDQLSPGNRWNIRIKESLAIAPHPSHPCGRF
jgi:hypothetical protein